MARILRGLSSRLLSCGCLLGIYETYDGIVIGLVDSKGGECAVAAHEPGNEIPVGSSQDAEHPADSADPGDA